MKVLRLILGVPRTTPGNVVSALAGEPPVYIRRQHLILKHTINECTNESPSHKLWLNLNNTHKRKMNSDTTICYLNRKDLIDNVEKTLVNNFNKSSPDINTDIHRDIVNKTKYSPNILKTIALSHINKIPNSCPIIYTDASKIDSQCGFGIYCPSTQYHFKSKLRNYSSIMTAEMMAIKQALIYAYSQNLENPKILTDSLSSCMAIENQTKKSHTTETIHEIINLLTKTGGSIIWVPAHVGIEGNERADQLAKDSITSEDSEVTNNKISLTDCKAMLTRELLEEWQKAYNEEEKGLKFKKIMPHVNKKPWFDRLNLDADTIKIINRLISNHSFDKRWLHRYRKVDTDLCDACNEIETAEHIVFKCKKYTDSRRTSSLLTKMRGVEDLWMSEERFLAFEEIKIFLKKNEIDF